jgi:hypothetical protein
MRRVVHPDSSNVQLPVLPDAKMDTRNEMRFPRCRAYATNRAHATPEKIMAKCGAHVNIRNCELIRLQAARG